MVESLEALLDLARDLDPAARLVLVQGVAKEQRDVLDPLAKRGHADRDEVEPLVEIAPESALLDLALQVAVGGGDDSHVRPALPRVADPLERLLLEEPQELGLDLDRELADLVEKQGSLVGRLHLADPIRGRSGEGALPVAEQLGLDHALLERRAEHGHERLGRARARVVDHARDDALARPGLAEEQHREAGGRHAAHQSLQLAHRGRAPDEAPERPVRGEQSPAFLGLGAEPSLRGAQSIALPDHLASRLEAFQDRARHVQQRAEPLPMLGGEVPLDPVLEVDERRDALPCPDRHAQDRGDAQLPDRLDRGEVGIVGDARKQHVAAGLEHAREQAATEATPVAFELLRPEAVEHPVLELARLGHFHEQAALGAGARHRLLEDDAQHLGGLRRLAKHSMERLDQLGGGRLEGVGHGRFQVASAVRRRARRRRLGEGAIIREPDPHAPGAGFTYVESSPRFDSAAGLPP